MMILIMLTYTFLLFISGLSAASSNNITSEKVLQMLIDCGGNVATLRNELQVMKENVDRLSTLAPTATYTRWGRKSCPTGATMVYDGFAAGSHHTHSGAAANYICLSKNPKWKYTYSKPDSVTYIYGAEYQTYESIWSGLHDHDVPCAVCLVPRSNVITVSGTYYCPDNYKREYSGYLMSGSYRSIAASEFVCVDNNAETIEYSSKSNKDGKLFYFVQAKCGSLKCKPYEESRSHVPCVPTLHNLQITS